MADIASLLENYDTAEGHIQESLALTRQSGNQMLQSGILIEWGDMSVKPEKLDTTKEASVIKSKKSK